MKIITAMHTAPASFPIALALAIVAALPASGGTVATPAYLPVDAELSEPAASGIAIPELTAQDLDQRVAAGLSLIEFYTTATKPAHTVLEQVVAEMGGAAFVGRVNLSDARAKAGQYNIKNVPTFIIFKDGVPLSTFVGLRDKSTFTGALRNLAVQPAAPVAATPAPAQPQAAIRQAVSGSASYQSPAPVPLAASASTTAQHALPNSAAYAAGLYNVPDGRWINEFAGFGSYTVPKTTWDGTGETRLKTGLATELVLGLEEKLGKIGWSIEYNGSLAWQQGDFFTYYNNYYYGKKISFYYARDSVVGRFIFYPNKHINFSVGGGIGFEYSFTDYPDLDDAWSEFAHLDLRATVNLSTRVALDLSYRLWTHGERDYGMIVGNSNSNSSFRVGMRFYWGGR
jgi:thioredoxin 1